MSLRKDRTAAVSAGQRRQQNKGIGSGTENFRDNLCICRIAALLAQGIVQMQHSIIFTLKLGGHGAAAEQKEGLRTMAVTTDFSAAKSVESSGFSAFLEDLKLRFARHRVYRRTVSELSALSNRELADLGLHRSMIRRVAMQAAQDYMAG